MRGGIKGGVLVGSGEAYKLSRRGFEPLGVESEEVNLFGFLGHETYKSPRLCVSRGEDIVRSVNVN
jgi:hypothetical protein